MAPASARSPAIGRPPWRTSNPPWSSSRAIPGCSTPGCPEDPDGEPQGGPHDLDRAILRGAQGTVRTPRALALMALGRASRHPDLLAGAGRRSRGPRGLPGARRAPIRLGLRQRALGDLEQAADWAADNPMLLPRITAAYAVCLGSQPGRFPMLDEACPADLVGVDCGGPSRIG